jgi:DNA-binding beta-propeller fold protein YncE
VASAAGAVWVGDVRDGTVTRVDSETQSVVKTIGIGGPAVDLAAHGGSVWVATGGFGAVVRIDAQLNAEVGRIELGEPNNVIVPPASAIAAGDEGVWVGAFDGLLRLDPRTGEASTRVDLGRTPALQIAVGGGAVWSTITSARAKRVEASSGQETAEFYAGDFVFAVALDRTVLWVGGADQLWKVDSITGSLIDATSVHAPVEGIALQEDAVWATLTDADALVRLDPETGERIAAIPLVGWPGEVAVEGGLVWVAVQEPESDT